MGKAEIVKQKLGRTLFIDAWTQSVRRRAIYTPYEPGVPFIKCQVYEADLAGRAQRPRAGAKYD